MDGSRGHNRPGSGDRGGHLLDPTLHRPSPAVAHARGLAHWESTHELEIWSGCLLGGETGNGGDGGAAQRRGVAGACATVAAERGAPLG
jgi:hypothetical protein